MTGFAPYKKDFDYSYALGLFPTLELLTAKPQAVQTVLLSSKIKDNAGLQKIRALCHAHTIKIEETDHAKLERLARSENCYAIGVFTKSDTQLDSSRTHVVLVNPDDMGNLGTIMRTCLGFDVDNVAIITPAADIYDPKTVRASMGALFRLRVARFATFSDYQRAFPNHQPYPFVLRSTQKLKETTFIEPASLIFGNEGAGLPPEFANIGTPVSIEQTEAVDSLNLALAVGVVLYKHYI